MYDLYEQMMLAYKTNDERLFAAAARNLVDNDNKNPFKEGTPEHILFFNAKKYCKRWRVNGIDSRSARRNMVAAVRQIAEMQPPNPYRKEETVAITVKEAPKKPESKKQALEKQESKKEEVKEEKVKKQEPEKEEQKNDDLSQDVQYVMLQMVNAYILNDNESYEMYVNHLMEIAEENPFLAGTDEHEMFETMKECYTHRPPNKRRTFVVGKQLCEYINNTELYPDKVKKPKETILGVVPDEKKSWFKFLFPWRKEGEQNDSSRSD